jgi:inosine/xanthosine triphosphate pyrophosphatase family protein
MSSELKNRVSHRGQAMRDLIARLGHARLLPGTAAPGR